MTMDYGLLGDRVDADEGVTIVLPSLPPSSVGPNSRLFYKKKSSEFSSQVEVMIGEINVQGAAQELLWEKVHLDITYVIHLQRRVYHLKQRGISITLLGVPRRGSMRLTIS